MKTRRFLSEFELFREQGITIASILTAIGMAISTLVLAVTGGGSAPVPSPAQKPSDKGGVKEGVKKHLQALGHALAKLAGKAAAALPGIIGSIVSWLLSTLGKAETWPADNVWALVIGVGALLLLAARDRLADTNQSATRPTPTPAAITAAFSSAWLVAAARPDACCS